MDGISPGGQEAGHGQEGQLKKAGTPEVAAEVEKEALNSDEISDEAERHLAAQGESQAAKKIPREADPERQMSDEPLRRAWSHSRLVVIGPAAIAAVAGRGREAVKEVQVLLPTLFNVGTRTAVTQGVEELQPVMDQAEYARFQEWLGEQGLQDRPIRLTREMELTAPFYLPVRNAPKIELWKDPNLPPAPPPSNNSLRLLATELASEPAIPERLEGNGTLGGALTAMEWGEMFELPYDDTPLRTAENLTRQARISLSNRASGYERIDPIFIERLKQNPELAEKLKKGHRRLAQLSRKIIDGGGMVAYIKENFGAAYLSERRTNNHSVRLDDPRLVDSPKSLDEQLDFLERWRAKSERFKAEGEPVLLSREVTLPRPEELAEAIYQPLLQPAIEARSQQPSPLDAMTGRYKLEVESNAEQQKSKAEDYLQVMGYGPLDEVRRPGESIADALIRIGIHPRDPFLRQLATTDAHEVELVISSEPEDILQASFKKPWTSCVDLERGTHAEGLYEDIQNGAVVAYLMRDGQYVARSIVRSGVTLDEGRPAAAIESVYGDERYEAVMRQALLKIAAVAGIATEKPMKTGPYSQNTFFDSASDAEGFDRERDYYLYYT